MSAEITAPGLIKEYARTQIAIFPSAGTMRKAIAHATRHFAAASEIS
jgi:hypothetical protein